MNDYLEDRITRWGEVYAVTGRHGSGYDVVLRLDGTYFGESVDDEAVREMVEHHAARLAEWMRERALDVANREMNGTGYVVDAATVRADGARAYDELLEQTETGS